MLSRYTAVVSFCMFNAATTAVRAAQSDVPPSEPQPELPYFSRGDTRPFASGYAVGGLAYGRLGLAGGYGKPHWIWVGLEGIGVLTPYFGSVQGGLHASAALVDLMVMARRTYSYTHGLLPEMASVSSTDLDQFAKPRLQYDVLDANLSGFVPYRRWLVTWELTYVRPLGVDSEHLLYEEAQRAVVSQHGLATTKLAPMIRPWKTKPLYAGLMVEHLTLLGRSDSLVVRLGPSLCASLGDHWDLFGFVTWPVISPDRLGLWEGMYGTAGLVYRVATGEPAVADSDPPSPPAIR